MCECAISAESRDIWGPSREMHGVLLCHKKRENTVICAYSKENAIDKGTKVYRNFFVNNEATFSLFFLDFDSIQQKNHPNSRFPFFSPKMCPPSYTQTHPVRHNNAGGGCGWKNGGRMMRPPNHSLCVPLSLLGLYIYRNKTIVIFLCPHSTKHIFGTNLPQNSIIIFVYIVKVNRRKPNHHIYIFKYPTSGRLDLFTFLAKKRQHFWLFDSFVSPIMRHQNAEEVPSCHTNHPHTSWKNILMCNLIN